MKRKTNIWRLLPLLIALLVLAGIWTFANGRGAQTWDDLHIRYMTFDGGMERSGENYGVMSAGPTMILHAGTYRLDYEIETDAPNTMRLVTTNTVSIVPGEVTLEPGKSRGSVTFTVYNETNNFQILIDYQAGSYLRVKDIDMVGNKCMDNVMTFTLVLLAFVALYALYLSGFLTQERAALFLVMGFAVMIASTPCFKKNLNVGDDMYFHLERLNNLTCGLRSGQFPVRVGGYMNRGYGAITSVYYMELFLYIPAAMIMLGTSIQYAMNVFLVLINAATAVTMFACARRMFKSDGVGAVASVLYTLASYRLTDVYARSALGEALAMAFLPLLALGLWEVLFGDKGRWPLLALGAAAIFESHMISTLFCAVTAGVVFLIFLPRVVREKRLGSVMLAAVCCVLLCAFSIVPLMTFSRTGIQTSMMPRWIENNAVPPAQILFSTVGELDVELDDPALRSRALEIGMPLLLGALAALWQIIRGKERGWEEKTALFLLIFGAGFALMATQMFPWGRLERVTHAITGYIQFPWRTLMMTDFFFALAGAWGLTKLGGERSDLTLFAALALCLVTAMPLLTAETKRNNFVVYGRVSEQGMCYLDYTLKDTVLGETEDQTIHELGDVTVSHVQKAGTTITAEVVARQDAQVSLPLFGFEGYAAEVDGQEMAVSCGEKNRLTVDLPAGTNGALRVGYAGKAYWKIADAVSLATAAGLIARGVYRKRRRA